MVLDENYSWKKNLDSRYISGEDLQNSLNGLSPEMVTEIVSFSDSESFDQKTQQKIIVTALTLKGCYKPIILNKTNAKVLNKEFGTDKIAQWVGKPFILFAQKDTRHGYVVRVKKYNPPILVLDSENFIKVKEAYKKGYTMEQIKTKYSLSKQVEDAIIQN